MTEPTPGPDSPALSVRAAEAADATALAAVAAETFPLACPPGTLPESIATFIATHLTEGSFRSYLSDPDYALFVGEVDGVVAGYTMIIFGEPRDADAAVAVTSRPTAELSKMYVRAAFHGLGLAKALVEASVDEARNRGTVSVWLGVNQHNARANRFYEKHGFLLVGTKRFLVGERYEDDFVRLRLL